MTVPAVACTHNTHKADELRALLPQLAFSVLGREEALPPETGATFLDNARIKARGGAAHHPGSWIVADDSGLCVDALDGDPGVRSARYAGPAATDEANVALLLDHLRDRDARDARFVCVLVAIGPDGRELVAEGSVSGVIAHAPAGSEGFGYDPVFIPHGEVTTFAELGAVRKARLSHRAIAASQLALLLDAEGAG